MAFEIGQRVGDYEILELLGRGGMGHVYRARNIISDRTEAMKVLLPDLSAERDLAVRFISEIRTLAGFDHPNIALLHTAFQADNQLIMIMEYVEGYTLEQRAKQSPMSAPEITGYISQALSALSYAHARNVIHRDIKPANLMVTSHGVVKLMDFGIAKSNVDINLTRPGTTIGSFYYMSPEQVRGTNVDARSDLYSIGVVLYELLAGRRPFESDSTYGVLNQQLNDAPQPPIEINPSLSPQLNAIILTALAKDPADRFQNADAFRNALKAFRNESAETPQGVNKPNAAFVAASNVPANAAAFSNVSASGQDTPPIPTQSAPQKSPRNNKPLWIATGALAAMLALVGLAVTVPHLLKTHASESHATVTTPPPDQSASVPSTQPSDNASAATPTVTPPTTSSATSVTPDNAAAGPSAPPPTVTSDSKGAVTGHSGTAHTGNKIGQAAQSNSSAVLPSPQGQSAAPPEAGPSEAELNQLQERMIQLSAKADALDDSVSQLRRQQEAQGLGLRNDMTTADNRMRSYIQAANQDMQASRVASANRNMDKAEEEILILDKFLGR